MVPQDPRAGAVGISKAEVSLLVQKTFGVSGKLSAGLLFGYLFIEQLSRGGSVGRRGDTSESKTGNDPVAQELTL